MKIIMPGFRKCNSASKNTLILGNLFHIYNLIHIDLKPAKILIASFLLAFLFNN